MDTGAQKAGRGSAVERCFGLAWSENSDHNFNTLQKMRRELEQPFYCGLNIQTQFHSAGKNLTIRTKTIYYRRRTSYFHLR